MMRVAAKARTRALELWKIGKGLVNQRHPILAHIIPMRRCNLACTYCNEFDDVSPPVPIDDMLRRVDKLGEPTLHPELDDIIRRIRKRGMIAGLITNGYFLTPERIERFNKAGLQHLQISIDNILPDDVSKKSLKVLDSKLKNLNQHGNFFVNIPASSAAGSRIRKTRSRSRVAPSSSVSRRRSASSTTAPASSCRWLRAR